MSDYINRQIEERNRGWNEAKAMLDAAASEKRDLTAEENEKYGRIMADMDSRDAVVRSMLEDEQRTNAIEDAVRGHVEARPPEHRSPAVADDNTVLRQLAAGEIRSASFGRRALNTVDDDDIVPQTFYAQMAELLTTVGPMIDGNVVTLVNTDSGEEMKWPVESARPLATAIAESTQIADLDPTFASILLKSQKVAILTKVSHEVLADSGIDLVSVLARSMGTSAGIKINGLLTLGTGVVEANGIVTASAAGVTGGTGVAGVPTADNLIDLAHSVDGEWVRRGAGWMMRRTTIGSVRKLKDTAGNYLYVPSANVGIPDEFMGFPIRENPDVVAAGTNAKSVLFGHFGSYHTRLVGGFDVARSEDAFFDTDEVGFRLTARIWGDLGQSAAVKHYVGGTA